MMMMEATPDPAQAMQVVVKSPLGRNIPESYSSRHITRMSPNGMRVFFNVKKPAFTSYSDKTMVL